MAQTSRSLRENNCCFDCINWINKSDSPFCSRVRFQSCRLSDAASSRPSFSFRIEGAMFLGRNWVVLTSTAKDVADEWIKAETAKDDNDSTGGVTCVRTMKTSQLLVAVRHWENCWSADGDRKWLQRVVLYVRICCYFCCINEWIN